eukprot:CAMPEP_0177608992 /NCGR_PEP_ID=MMETSP0419_2-20121207/18803_1 /TAXON_ID=582737 /ORGANISM="Tetraselmis sp., Strain GSL018" /LENGTH=93 /DNA_ID=CAMNT_0019103791 /DNA_START=278 /DNA_END=559 /DNA_ORIENTATION=+
MPKSSRWGMDAPFVAPIRSPPPRPRRRSGPPPTEQMGAPTRAPSHCLASSARASARCRTAPASEGRPLCYQVERQADCWGSLSVEATYTSSQF